jgi:hypothetical protein
VPYTRLRSQSVDAERDLWDVIDSKGRVPGTLLDEDLDDPVEVARLFMAGLLTPVEALSLLEFLVAPETREQWGDFAPTGREH